MARPRRDNRTGWMAGRTVSAVLLPFYLVFLCVSPALSESTDKILERSGILYPDGFDQNTVGEVQGKVRNLMLPPSGPVRFRLTSNNETYSVIVSPRWYWEDLGVELTEGEEVRVAGSKSMGRDGNLYIIAQKIRVPSQNRSFVIRSNNGRPLWKGAGQGSSNGQRGFGPPRGFGGMWGGPGGMGHGRR